MNSHSHEKHRKAAIALMNSVNFIQRDALERDKVKLSDKEAEEIISDIEGVSMKKVFQAYMLSCRAIHPDPKPHSNECILNWDMQKPCDCRHPSGSRR